MRTSIKWLKDYVDFDETPETLANMLTMAGTPVEAVEYRGGGIENVVTGRITAMEKHPDADRLSVCKLDVGAATIDIVTGATNVMPGQVVPVALHGAKLPSGQAIQRSKLRGVVSHGMLCSAAELNLDLKLLTAGEKDGIYILPDDLPLGLDIKAALGLDDVVLEFELTANRADCFSVYGLAREISALTGNPLKSPMYTLREAGEGKAGGLASVTIADPALCPRFSARILQDVKIGPSPRWIKQRLEAAGIRAINNVVDAANFVMLEIGQPLHTYDYDMLAQRRVVVRKAAAGEPLTTLDGVKRSLTEEMIVIGDASQAVGLAGVMGGLATEITAATKNVLVESAVFNSACIRRTGRALGMRSEASGRYERGVDAAGTVKALDRVAKLLEDMGACKVCPGVIDAYPAFSLPAQVVFDAGEISRQLGVMVGQAEIIDILRRLGFECDCSAAKITATVPSWRADVRCSADIAEEVARMYGFDKIPAALPDGGVMSGGQDETQRFVNEVRDILVGAGLDETISFSFTHPHVMDKLQLPADSVLRGAIPILNPITDEFPILRTSLAGCVLETLARNLARKNERVRIFEIGSVFLPHALPLTELPREETMLCGAICGRRDEPSWNKGKEPADFYDAKGIVETLLAKLHIAADGMEAGRHDALHPGKTGVFKAGDTVLATVGEVHPEVLAAFGISPKVYLFEIDVALLKAHRRKAGGSCSLPKYPAVTRDLAVVLPERFTAAQVQQAIAASAGPLLRELRLFDVYTGGQVPPGCRSLAFSLVFQAADRTLTDAQADTEYRSVLKRLETDFAAQLRS